MPQGLQVFNADGSIRLDTSTLLGRVIGTVGIGAGQRSGTITSDEFVKGTPFLVGLFQMGNFDELRGPAFSQVTYTSNGRVLSWSRVSNSREPDLPAGQIYYGVF